MGGGWRHIGGGGDADLGIKLVPACARRVEIGMRVDLWPARGISGVLGDKQRCDREVAVDMLPCCRRGAGVAGAARRDHDGYSDSPGRPVLPDGGTLPRLAHAEKKSETACSRVTDESVRVPPRVPYRSHASINHFGLDVGSGASRRWL